MSGCRFLSTAATSAALLLGASLASAQTVVLDEDFESGVFPPTGWVEQNNGVSPGWEGEFGRAVHDDYVGVNHNWLVLPELDFTGRSAVYLHGLQGSEWTAYRDENTVEISLDQGASFQRVYTETTIGDGRNQALELDLTAYAGQPSVLLAFRYRGDFANEWSIEWVRIDDQPPGVPPLWPELPSSFVPAAGAFEDFESGVVPPHVALNMLDEVTRLPDVRAWCNLGQLATNQFAFDGTGSLEMGLAPGDPGLHYASNAWVGGFDGQGRNEIFVEMQVMNLGEEKDPDDGVWLSTDGQTWVNLLDDWDEATGGYLNLGQWQSIRIPLGKAGLDLTGNFYLALAQSDNRAFADSDGLVIDELRVWIEPFLFVTENGAGATAELDVSDAVPGSTITALYSLDGPGPVDTPFGKLDLTLPIYTLDVATADAAGNAQFSGFVPPGMAGRTVWMQASMGWAGIVVVSNPAAVQF